MRVIQAEVAGMCFGVRDALRTVAAIPNANEVTIHGHLVHNEVVLTQLGRRGFHIADEQHRPDVPATEHVLITAHGISDTERQRLVAHGKTLIDTTCPLVVRVHRAAQELQREGYFVIVIGRPQHVEVRGIVGDLRDYTIVDRPEAVENYPARRLGVICQSTTAPHLAEQIRQAIRDANPDAEIRAVDTICAPTRAHQQSLLALLPQVDVVVVVGGRNSNNTRELVKLCHERGVVAYQVVEASEVQAHWFSGMQTIGLTAGTSTLDETLREVREVLEALPAQSGDHLISGSADFRLPVGSVGVERERQPA